MDNWTDHLNSLVVGIDEVGRGCLAGPVVVAAVVFPKHHSAIAEADDSKKLSRKKRELLEPLIKYQALAVGIGQVEAKIIDQIGIVAAIKKAADIALSKIILKTNFKILSDGPKPLNSPIKNHQSIAIINGDAKIYSIAAASIVAKVYRDHLMYQQALKYPGYKWETNVGYGTKFHLDAIKKSGFTPLHRRTFVTRVV